MSEIESGKIIKDWSELLKLRDSFRQNGLKVVFTNGVFDILHRGHLEYLEAARRSGDVLLVGVNSDASVRRLKGEHRPIVSEEDRMFALSRLRMVDVITLFDQDTPLELIKQVKPDVLVKGADYQEDEIVGAAEVKSSGGQVSRIPLVEGCSTSSIIEEIIARNKDH